MTCNFLGMLKAPELAQDPVFVATYSDGFGLKRKEITAPNRLVAYAIASMRPPLGHTLSQLRKKKSPYATPAKPVEPLEEAVDVKLTRALVSIYANTDLACRFAAEEIRSMAAQPSA